MQTYSVDCPRRLRPYHLYIASSNLTQGLTTEHDNPDMPKYYPGSVAATYFLHPAHMQYVVANKARTKCYLDLIVQISEYQSNREHQNMKLLRLQWSHVFEEAMVVLQKPALFDLYTQETERQFMRLYEEEQKQQRVQGGWSMLELGDMAMCRAVLGEIFKESLDASKFPNADNEVLVSVIHHNTENDMVECRVVTPHTWLPSVEYTTLHGKIARHDLVVLLDNKKRVKTKDFVWCLYGDNMGVGHIVQVWQHTRAPWFNGLEVRIVRYDAMRACWFVSISSSIGAEYEGMHIMLDPEFTDTQLRQRQGLCASVQHLYMYSKYLLEENERLLKPQEHDVTDASNAMVTIADDGSAQADTTDSDTAQQQAAATEKKDMQAELAQLAAQLAAQQAAATERERLQAELAKLQSSHRQELARERAGWQFHISNMHNDTTQSILFSVNQHLTPLGYKVHKTREGIKCDKLQDEPREQ